MTWMEETAVVIIVYTRAVPAISEKAEQKVAKLGTKNKKTIEVNTHV